MKNALLVTALVAFFVGIVTVGVSVAKHRYDICREDGWSVVVCIAAMGS